MPVFCQGSGCLSVCALSRMCPLGWLLITCAFHTLVLSCRDRRRPPGTAGLGGRPEGRHPGSP